MEFTRDEINMVSIWIRFPGLDFKYYSPKGLSKIGSLIGRPMIMDQNIKKKNGLNFANLLVEVKMGGMLPDAIRFRSEKELL